MAITLRHIANIIYHPTMVVLRTLAVVIILLFIRLLYGPLDITWATPMLIEGNRATHLKSLAISMDAREATVSILASVALPTAAPEDKPDVLSVKLIPHWWRLLHGERKIKEISIVAPDLVLPPLEDGGMLDTSDIHHNYRQDWSALMGWVRSVLQHLQGRAPPKLSLTIPRVTLAIPGEDGTTIELKNLVIALHDLRINDRDIHGYLSLSRVAQIAHHPPSEDEPILLKSATLDVQLLDQDSRVDTPPAGTASGNPFVQVSLTRLELDDAVLGGSLEGRFDGNNLAFTTIVSAGNAISVQTLKRLWPSVLASSAHRWVTQNIHQGTIKNIALDTHVHVDPKGVPTLQELAGRFSLDDVALSYFGGLPPIVDLSALVTFSGKGMSFAVEKGTLNGLSLTNGTVLINGFDDPLQTIEIRSTLHGPVTNVLEAINAKPLTYLDRAGMHPNDVTGTTDATLSLSFPLLNDVRMEDVDLNVKGSFSKADLKRLPTTLPFGIFLQKGTYKINGKSLDFRATGTADGYPLRGRWQLFFGGGSKTKKQDRRPEGVPRMIVEADGRAPLSLVQKMGFDFAPYVTGQLPLPYQLKFSLYDGEDGHNHQPLSGQNRNSLHLNVDTSSLTMEIPWLGWYQDGDSPEHTPPPSSSNLGLTWLFPTQNASKNAATPNLDHATHEVNFTFTVKHPNTSPPHEKSQTDTAPLGKVMGTAFVKGGGLTELHLGPSWLSHTHISEAKVNRLDTNSWKAKVTADTLNVTPILSRYVGHGIKEPSTGVHHHTPDVPKILDIDLQLTTKAATYVRDDYVLGNSQVHLKTKRGKVTDLYIETQYHGEGVDGKATGHFSAQPGTPAHLNLHATNAGYLLSFLDTMKRAVGGELSLQAQRLPMDKNGGVFFHNFSKEAPQKWHGTLRLENFILQKAPTMARLLSMASVAGLTDLLNKHSGLYFDKLEVQGNYSHDRLILSEIVASSPSIGMRARGEVTLTPTAQINLQGTFTPFNYVNTLVGYIPLVGQILTGAHGEGVFSFTFTLKGDLTNPTVQVNPLSILAPGILGTMVASTSNE